MTDTSEIIRIAARGDGVTADGRHAPLVAPGDLLRIDGSVIEGPHRATPPCRHFPTCGGCQLQHIDWESYSGFIVDRISEALTAQRLTLPPIAAPHLSPPRTRRRATLHGDRRGNQAVLGFTAEGSHSIVDMRECHVLLPELFALVPPLRELLARMLKAKRRADVVMTMTDQGIDLLLSGVSADDLERTEALTAFAMTHKLARLSLDDGLGPETRWEPQPVTVTLGGVPVPLPIDAFLQATQDGEAALIAAMRDAVGDAATVADLFSGIGTFAFALPPTTKVYAAEASRDALAALKAAATRAQRMVFPDHRDLFRRPVTTAELDRFAAIVIDPPRAGAEEQMKQIAASKVTRVASISCNPTTFARDAKILVQGGYTLDWIRPVGQFTWSTHVELAASFSRPVVAR